MTNYDTMKCEECGKDYEPDQYIAWCNECGEKLEADWFNNWFMNEDLVWQHK